MKTFFELPSYYEGTKVRRLKHSGRLWLARVMSDPDGNTNTPNWKPYWFVLIKSFDPRTDAQCGAKSIGVWRFRWLEEAEAKFEELRKFFPETPKREPTAKQIAARMVFSARNRRTNPIKGSSGSTDIAA